MFIENNKLQWHYLFGKWKELKRFFSILSFFAITFKKYFVKINCFYSGQVGKVFHLIPSLITKLYLELQEKRPSHALEITSVSDLARYCEPACNHMKMLSNYKIQMIKQNDELQKLTFNTCSRSQSTKMRLHRI